MGKCFSLGHLPCKFSILTCILNTHTCILIRTSPVQVVLLHLDILAVGCFHSSTYAGIRIEVSVFKCKCGSVSVQVYVQKCQCSSASVEVSVCKCKCRSVSVQEIFRKNPSQCFREKQVFFQLFATQVCLQGLQRIETKPEDPEVLLCYLEPPPEKRTTFSIGACVTRVADLSEGQQTWAPTALKCAWRPRHVNSRKALAAIFTPTHVKVKIAVSPGKCDVQILDMLAGDLASDLWHLSSVFFLPT